MKLTLDLSRHCIETEIRRCYNSAMSDYFRKGEEQKPRLEQIIHMTQQALEHWDFGRMRSTHRALAGGTNAIVTLCQDAGKLTVIIDDQPVVPILLRS